MKNKIGRYAVCGAGRIGKIEKVSRLGFAGTGLDGKPWVSRTPRMIRASQVQYLGIAGVLGGGPITFSDSYSSPGSCEGEANVQAHPFPGPLEVNREAFMRT